MSFLGFNDFSDSIRSDFIERIYYRMDTIYSNWLSGEYYDCDLETCVDSDFEVRELQTVWFLLHRHFRSESIDEFGIVNGTNWLADRLEMDEFPTRVTRVIVPRDLGYTASGFQYLRSMPRDFESVCESDSDDSVSVADTPRRSTRVKKQREFYYGF